MWEYGLVVQRRINNHLNSKKLDRVFQVTTVPVIFQCISL